MPFYEYSCSACGTGFEKLRRMDQRLKAPPCPSCQSERTVFRLSAPGMVGAGRTATFDGPACDTADPGGCCGGACMQPVQ